MLDNGSCQAMDPVACGKEMASLPAPEGCRAS